MANHSYLEKNKAGETMPQWVARNGGQVLANSNDFERCRFMDHGQSQVIYEGKRGVNYSSFRAKQLYWNYVSCIDSPLGAKTKYHKSRSIVMRTIIERDGPECFYCGTEFSDTVTPTIEHLVARAHNGPDHISNKFASCKECNSKAGHLSAPEKIVLRDKLRMQP